MSLEILMGTQKGHFAYRLAWANTSSARIPFLPLHQRDLLFAEEGNQNYLDGNINCINWRKFEIMGDIIIGIQQSQGIPYSDLNQNEELRHLILDGIFSNDEDVSRRVNEAGFDLCLPPHLGILIVSKCYKVQLD